MSNLVPCQAVLSVKRKLHDAIEKIQQYLLTLPFIIGLLRIRDDISEKLRQLILAFFGCLSPCWNFLFIHKSKPNTKIRRVIETIAPNPFEDEQSDNGPTDSKSHGSKTTTEFSHFYKSIVNSDCRTFYIMTELYRTSNYEFMIHNLSNS